jgi:hypothetical protein
MPRSLIVIAAVVVAFASCGPAPSPKGATRSAMAAARNAEARSRGMFNNSLRHDWKRSRPNVDDDDDDAGEGEGGE